MYVKKVHDCSDMMDRSKFIQLQSKNIKVRRNLHLPYKLWGGEVTKMFYFNGLNYLVIEFFYSTRVR
jgi:hypothetical protein